MQTQKLIAKVIFTAYDNDSEYQGFEVTYEPTKSIEQYIEQFERETVRMNSGVEARDAYVEHLKTTVHDEQGNFTYDEDGRIEQYIYKKEKPQA